VAGCCECGDEPSGSCATELVSYMVMGIKRVACHHTGYSVRVPGINRPHETESALRS
jgi:hypothetical protein